MNSSGIYHRVDIPASDAQLRSAVARGSLIRVCRGWYATPDAEPVAIAARKVGGVPTSQSLLRLHGIWLFPDNRLHVLVPQKVGRVYPERVRADVCIHYLPAVASEGEAIVRACQAMAFCSPLEAVVAAIDSCLDKRMITLEQLIAGSVQNTNLRQAVERAEYGSQSGIETRLRLFFRAHRISYRTQVQLLPDARVDFLVGRRLVVEVDGYQYHSVEQFDNDRRRDLELVKRGFRVIRLSYHMMSADWEASQRQILEIVRRREHFLEPRWNGNGG